MVVGLRFCGLGFEIGYLFLSFWPYLIVKMRIRFFFFVE